jgi:hypothetical protein
LEREESRTVESRREERETERRGENSYCVVHYEETV